MPIVYFYVYQLSCICSVCVLRHPTSSAVLASLRKHEDGWVFEDPVTESIAPGYFDVVDKPMEFSTVEKKVEANQYQTKDEVGA